MSETRKWFWVNAITGPVNIAFAFLTPSTPAWLDVVNYVVGVASMTVAVVLLALAGETKNG